MLYQCTQCGQVQQANELPLEDDMYAKLTCPHCKKLTKHLECGTNIIDFYKYYNPSLDKRFWRRK